MGILAFHAQTYTPLWGVIEGTKSMPVIWLVAVIAGALAALVIGALSLRTSGVYFIMITLAFGQMLFYFAISWPAYGGEDGLSIYLRNDFPGVNTLDPINFFLICFALLARCCCSGRGWPSRPSGWRCKGRGRTPRGCEAVGLALPAALVAFVISGAITGLAGALFADLNRFVSPNMLSWQMSGELII